MFNCHQTSPGEGQDIDELIVRVLQGEASWEDEVALSRWRRRSGENEGYFHEVASIWWHIPEPEPDTAPPLVSTLMERAQAEHRAGYFHSKRFGVLSRVRSPA